VIHGGGVYPVLIMARLRPSRAGTTWIVRAASATPSVSASTTGGSSWSCVHSPLKLLVRIFDPVQYFRICQFRVPIGCGVLLQRWHAAIFPAAQIQPLPSTIKSRKSVRGAWFNLHAELRVGLDAIVSAIAVDRYLVKQTRIGEKVKMMRIGFRYPLSVIGIYRASGNGLGRGRPTRERGQ